MPELKRSFQSGRMNKDLDERLVPNGEYRDALNIEIATSESDDLGSAQTTKGNKLVGSDLPNPSAAQVADGAWPHLQGNWNEIYRNKVVGKVVDEKDNWGYRLIAGPPPQEPMPIPPAFLHQTNLISADYIVRNNDTTEEPVLVDIYSVSVGRHTAFPVPSSPVDEIHVPDIRGLRLGMELNIYVVGSNGNIVNWANHAIPPTSNKKAPKIVSWNQVGAGEWKIKLNGEIDFNTTVANNLVFSAPRALNFEHNNLITGINIIDDFLFWTDNYSEPKKIHIPKSVLGCRHPFVSAGTTPFDFYQHTNFPTKKPAAISGIGFNYWLGDADDAGFPGGRPVEEKHITVIKESPHLTPVLEMVKDRGNTNTTGAALDNFDAGTSTVFNPFFDNITQAGMNDEVWIGYGGPLSIIPLPCIDDGSCSPANNCPPVGANPPTWNPGCSIDFSVVPFYQAGEIVIFTVPGSSPILEIRAEILLGPAWGNGAYKVRIISSSDSINNLDIGWISELESTGELFEYKFPRFATRYKYEDGEYSTYSPFTEVAFLPDKNPMDYLPEKGYNLNMTNNLRELAIKGFVAHDELLPDDVESIEIVYKESDSSNIYSVTTVERNSGKWFALSNNVAVSGWHWDKTKGYVKITSEMIKGTIAPNQLLRPWDAVPRKALAQEITGNRLLYGNYLQNYDLDAPDLLNCGSGSNISCEAQVAPIETDLHFGFSNYRNVGILQPEEENVEDVWNYGPAKSIKTLRTYQLGIVYRDKYGRETPVFSSIDMTKYHEKDWADKSSNFATAVKNVIPDFAESFKFFIKETSNEYYNLPMDRWYPAEDGNIWLSFPSSERSKVSANTDEERFEDTFLILKKEHDNSTFVADPARYKVLAVENDAPTFIKTVKTPIGILSGLGSALFSVGPVAPQSLQGFPTPLFDFIRIVGTLFEGMGWDTTVAGPSVVKDLRMRIGTNIITSEWYTIISAFPVTGSSPLEYEIKVERDFTGDMVFSATDTLNIEIYEEEVKYLPEFDGRFFVKIYRDPTLESTILATALASAGSYQVISSMVCQVIDPNSAWSIDTVPDSWDGWNSTNAPGGVTSTFSPMVNYSANANTWPAVNEFINNAIPPVLPYISANAVPITGPDWAISNNATPAGQGESYWQSFEAQDTTFGSGNATRWFIDGRSGQNQMFQTYREMPSMLAHCIGPPQGSMREAMFELDNTGTVINPQQTGIMGGARSRPSVNATVPSVANNPSVPQSARLDLSLSIILGGAGGRRTGAGWSDGENYTPARFKSPSQSIYADTNGNMVYIDLSCMGFGGPEIGTTLPNWNHATAAIPYNDTLNSCGINCNSAWLVDNTQYLADIIFINAITTAGTIWKWAEDPDDTLYQTQNSNTLISDWINSGGTLGGWKRVGDSSIHFNTQTIGMTTHSGSMAAPSWYDNLWMWNDCNTHFNQNNPYSTGGVIRQLKSNANPYMGSTVATTEDLAGESASNTANWNRSQRWTIEARTLSGGNALGSGPAGYLPTNDPRWIQGVVAGVPGSPNPTGAAPGVRHDGMGSGETSVPGMTSTDGTTGVINAPGDYDADVGGAGTSSVTSGSFTWQILLPQSSLTVPGVTGSFSSSNPAIWETEPKKSIDLDIYYEIGQVYATRLNERTNILHAPVGSEVRIYRPADSPYVVLMASLGTIVPTGWIPWLAGPMFIGAWNIYPGSGATMATPYDPTFPNEIQIIDINGVPVVDLSNQTSPYPGDLLVFYRADGSTTEAEIPGKWDAPGFQPWFNVNKLQGVYSLDEDIANRYIRLPWFNCYSFGNGVESNRIRDDFNEVIIDKGPKASTTTSKTYKEERRGSGLIFSGIFNSKTGVNNLNQFIEAEGITKDLNPTYGSIQKLHSRDTDVVTLCEEKCLKILANKDALFNADGNINMIMTKNVLGQAVAYAGAYGISKNPESFVAASFRSYFTDKSKGAVLRLSQDGLTPISNVGMKDWFSDNLPSAYEIIGSFDEKKGNYNVTIYDHNLDIKAGEFVAKLAGNTLTFNENVKGWSSFKSFLQEQGFSLHNNYYTAKHGNIWRHHDSTVNRNNFYNEQNDSSITLLFNEQPGSVKSFNTLNYEGSQAHITRDITNPEHYDNWAKKGWYVNKMTTNLQETNNLEFKDKEGKWFAQIKGDATTWNNYMSAPLDQRGNIDPREFSYQGIDEASRDPEVDPCIWGCTDPTATNYNEDCDGTPVGLATCDDGCCKDCIWGCMDPDACNYDPTATCDSGECNIVYGCMNAVANNFDPLATCPCSPDCCEYTQACVDPVATLKNSGGKIETSCGVYTDPFITFWVDTDGGGNTSTYNWWIMDSSGVIVGSGSAQAPGQLNPVSVQPIIPPPSASPSATTYYLTVNDINGCSLAGHILTTLSSEYLIYGCTDINAVNYIAPMPDCDDSSCIVPAIIYGCMEPSAGNYASTATAPCDSSVFGCIPPNCNGPGSVWPDASNTCCDVPAPIYGCMDPTAANYDILATAPCDSTTLPTADGCLTANNPLMTPNNLMGVPICIGPIQAVPNNVDGDCCVTTGPYNGPLPGCQDDGNCTPATCGYTSPTGVAALNYNVNAGINAIANGDFSNVIGNGSLLFPDVTAASYTVYPNGSINASAPPPFNSGTHFYPGYSCVYDQPGCTDDGGQGTGLQSIPGSAWGGVPARDQVWWTANYAIPTGIALYPALAPTNYGPSNFYDVNATSDDGSCNATNGYDWGCNSAGTKTLPENFVNIVNPAGLPNGWWDNDSCKSNPSGDPMIEASTGGVNIIGDGTVDPYGGPHDHVGLEWFAVATTTQTGPGTFPCSGNHCYDFGDYKFLDNANTLPTPSTGVSYCPDITGATLWPQPGYWKKVTRIRWVDPQDNPVELSNAFCTNICGQVYFETNWHTSWWSLIEELQQSCTCQGTTYWPNWGNTHHGMSYQDIMTSLTHDNYHLEVEQTWCQCDTWHGAECVIDPSGAHGSKNACESGSCCPGDPTSPQCN